MNEIQKVTAGDVTLAYVVPAGAGASETTFITPPETGFQMGFVVYPAGGAVAPHVHLPIERELVGTTEFLLVREGRCTLDLYDEERELVASRELAAGDCVLLVAGGHGLRMAEDTVVLEVKQGPYIQQDEKERFQA